MPDGHKQPKRGEGSPGDPSYSRDHFYTGGTDDKGHNERIRDIKVKPWLKDVMSRLAEEIPAYKGQFGTMVRNYCTHGIQHDIELIEDPKKREALMRDFQLHMDMESQARELNRFAEMQRYVASTRVTLAVYSEAKNWMFVSRELERMKKRLADGLLWEPCVGEVKELIVEYEAKLSRAKS